MACFLVPGTEAIVVSAIYAAVKKKENRLDLPTDHAAEVAEKSVGITWSSVGVSMAITVTVFWALLCAAAEAKVKKIKAAVGQNA